MSDPNSPAIESSRLQSLADWPAGSVREGASCAAGEPRGSGAVCANGGVGPSGADMVRQAAAATLLHERPAAAGGVEALGLAASTEPSGELTVLLARLCAAVTRFMRERRDAGVPVERALAEVKGLVRDARASERWHDLSDALLGQAVRWAIAAYYETAPAPTPALPHVHAEPSHGAPVA